MKNQLQLKNVLLFSLVQREAKENWAVRGAESFSFRLLTLQPPPQENLKTLCFRLILLVSLIGLH